MVLGFRIEVKALCTVDRVNARTPQGPFNRDLIVLNSGYLGHDRG